MPDTLTPLTKAQDQIIETIELVQERVIDTNQKIASTLSERVPAQIADRLNVLPSLTSLPGIEAFPHPAQAVDTYFSFVERVTKANHKFATEIVNVWTPAETAAETAAPKAAAPKAAAAKKSAPARKRAAKKPAAEATTK